ncbi:MAG: cobyric acid synthase [Oligoflexus sp.]
MTQLAKTLMIQGTASSVGKSLLTTGLCRLFARKGFKVAPFKAQNMALNSYVTIDGGEIGRAQAIQADAAGIAASVDMNPILLKPEAERSAQVVVQGKVLQGMSARQYHEMKPQLRQIILDSLLRLRQDYDLVLIEGAGSPVEMNLKAHDIVNMFVATSIQSPTLLVGDIDRGGIFASLIGTIDLLEPHEKELVCGLVINKFRGDPDLLGQGVQFIEERSHKKVLGIVPFLKGLRIAEEDSLALDERPRRLRRQKDILDIAVIRYPRISNYDEFDALEHEAHVHLAYIEDPKEAWDADLLIMPGSKNTVTDLQWLREQGFAELIQQRLHEKRPIMAICGGCQMLGWEIFDPFAVESSAPVTPGLKLAPYDVHFQQQKVTYRRQALLPKYFYSLDDQVTEQPAKSDMKVEGYEIHMGQLTMHQPDEHQYFARILQQNHLPHLGDGFHDPHQRIFSSLLHGLFENHQFRGQILRELWQLRGHACPRTQPVLSKEAALDRLADHLEEHLDIDYLSHAIWKDH